MKLFSNKACLKPVLAVDVLINGEMKREITLKKSGIKNIGISLRDAEHGLLEGELPAKKTFVPASCTLASRDERELRPALCTATIT